MFHTPFGCYSILVTIKLGDDQAGSVSQQASLALRAAHGGQELGLA